MIREFSRSLRRSVSRRLSRRAPGRPSRMEPVAEPAAATSSAPTLDLDEERRRRNVRLYVYRLYEVRNWLAECLGEDAVPEPIELEEALRSGVLLAKLAHYFAPELVAKDKIFDLDESRLREDGFHYRHTDNINLWRRACLSVRIKEIVLPDPVDVYAGRNIKTVLALVTLATQLYRLRKSPPIRDQTGNVQFTEETYKLLGSKVGLANGNFALGPTTIQAISLPDEPSLDIFLKSLNESLQKDEFVAFDRLVKSTTLLVHVEPTLLHRYFEQLKSHFRTEGRSLGMQEVQGGIILVNREHGVEQLTALIDKSDADLKRLAQIIMSMDISDGRVFEAYLHIYLAEFDALHQNKELVYEKIEEVVNAVNAAADLREATNSKHPVRIYEALCEPALNLGVRLNADCTPDYAEVLIHHYTVGNAPLLYGSALASVVKAVDIHCFQNAVRQHDDTVVSQFLRRTSSSFDDNNESFYLSHIYGHADDVENYKDDVFGCMNSVVRSVNERVKEERDVALKMYALNEALLKTSKRDCDRLIQEISVLVKDPIEPNQSLDVYNNLERELQRKCEGRKRKSLSCMKHDFELGGLSVVEADENGNVKVVPAVKCAANADPWTLNSTDFKRCVTRVKRLQEEDSSVIETPVTLALKNLDNNEVTWDLMKSEIPALESFRKLVGALQTTSHIYDEEILLEDLKRQARKVIEQNMEMDRRLRETEENIGLLLKNFRHMNHTADTKTLKKQKLNVIEAHDKARERSDEKRFFDSLSTLLYYLRINSGRMAHFVRAVYSRCPARDFFLHFGQLYNYGRTPMEELSMMMFFGHLLAYFYRTKKNKFALDAITFPYTELFDEAIWSAECLRIRESQPMAQTLRELAKTPVPLDVSAGILAMQDIATRGLVNIDEAVKPRLQEAADFIIKWADELAKTFAEAHLPIALDFLLGSLEDEVQASTAPTAKLDEQQILLFGRYLVYEFTFAPYLRQLNLTSELMGPDQKLDEKHADLLQMIQIVLSAAVHKKKSLFQGFDGREEDLAKIVQVFENLASVRRARNRGKPPTILYGLGHYAQLLQLPSTSIKLHKSSIPYITDCLLQHVNDFETDHESQLLELFNDLYLPSAETFEQLPAILDVQLRALPEARLNDDRLAGDVVLETKLLVIKLLRAGLEGRSIKELLDNNALTGVADYGVGKELLEKLRNNLRMLSSQGLFSPSNDYNDLLKSMGQDIREDRERRDSRLAEIRDLQNVLSYSERTRQEMQGQVQLFKAYEDGCIKSIVGGVPSITLAEDAHRKVKKFLKKKEKAVVKREAITLSSEKLIRKKLLFLEDATTPKQVSKFSIRVSPSEGLGTYLVECYHSGKLITSKIMDFEKLLRLEDKAEVSIPFHGPIVFNCPELRKFIDEKFHYKVFA